MSLWEANQAALRWLRSSEQERNAAFSDFASKQFRVLQKQGDVDMEQRRVEEALEAVLRDELNRLPTNRRLTEAELEQFIENISERTAEEMQQVLEDELRDSYVQGLQEVAGSVGLAMNFTPRHQRTFQQAMSGETLADTFAGFSERQANTIRSTILQAYEDGRVSPGRISTRLVQEIGHEVRSDLERIAATETWKIYQTARDEAYQEAEEELGEEFQYEFGTVDDEKTCDVCREIMRRTEGGVPLDELKDIIVEVSTDPDYGGSENWDPTRDRNFPLPHPNCRHRHYRRVEVHG